MPDATPRETIHKDPSSGSADGDPVAIAVSGRIPGTVVHDSHGQAVLYVPRDGWHASAQYLRDDEQFTQCVDVTVVDHLLDEDRVEVDGGVLERFEVVANYLSHPRNRRVRVICEVPDRDPTVASITDLYPGVDFAEREAYDLFGITFDGHPDLSRILMPDDWVGHPLRKDDAPATIPVTFKEDPSPR
jgi:NADH-quinone oxidoreductase subunit C